MSAQFDKLLPLLVNGGIEFILIGGVAGNVLGSARLTFDVDVVYARGKANVERIAKVLKRCPWLPDSERATLGKRLFEPTHLAHSAAKVASIPLD
jgi:hypothetical protein